MKFRRLLLAVPLLAAAFLGARPAHADTPAYDADMLNNPTIAYSTTVVLDVRGIDTLAMHAVYSSATISAFSLDDGRKATGTITVGSTQTLTNARVAINGCILNQGGAWTAVSTASGTASAIATAINATPCLTGTLAAGWGGGTSAVIFTTASTIGTAGNAITLFSNSSSITVSGATLSNGDNSSFSTSSDKVTTAAGHGISTGAPLLLAKVTGTVPTGLTDATTYYAIVTANNQFQLAATSTGSLVASAVDITALTGGGTFTLTLTAFTGTPSFKWQAGNDNANWVDLAVSSVTYSTPGSTLWDGAIDYKYLRLNFVAGTGGALNLRCAGFGKKRGS